ncbi:hypothetical protein [uncultured Hymenobacter sp.]|uniref:hypothetical protein n=1 Tax=uncultured Hymenobacter sp. TaxID=170016 RepID=UPI0035CB20F4
MRSGLLFAVWALLLLSLLAGCCSCPLEACHVRKVHLHEGTKYRGQPLWKKQNPAVGEKIKTLNTKTKRRGNDRSKAL